MKKQHTEEIDAVERLTGRIRYLENLNEWMLEAFEAVAHTGELNANSVASDSLSTIFELTRDHLRRFFAFDTIAFLKLDPTGSEFVIDKIDPPEERAALEAEIEKLIEEGSFGYAVQQKRAITISSRNDAHLMIVHTIATRTGIQGMFIGLMKDITAAPNEVMLNILSILLFKTAAAMEQQELYRYVTDQNKILEQKVAARTQELQQLLERQKEVEQQLRSTIEKMEAAIMREQAAQARMVKTEMRYQHLFETVQDIFFETDWDRNLLDISPSVERYTGYTREELIGQNISFAYFDASDKERVTDILNTQGEVNDYEIFLNTKNGERICCSLSAVIVKDDHGRAVGLRGSVREITRRKQAEVLLQRSEAQLAEAQAIAHIGSWHWQIGSHEIQWSDELYRIYGLLPQSERILSERYWAYVHPEDMSDFRNSIEQNAMAGRPFYCGYRIIRPNGDMRWLEVSGRAVGPMEKNSLELIGAVKDVTDQRLINEALRASETKYRSVVNSVKEVIFQIDAAGRWTFLNPAWEEVTGFSVEESLGQFYLTYIHRDDWDRSKKLFHLVIEGKTEFCRQELRFSHIDGTHRWIEVYAIAIRDTAGSIIGAAGTLMDITIRKNAEEELRQAKEDLEIRVEERTSELQYTVGQLNIELNERKLAEERIREQAALLDKAHDAISVRDLQGRLRFWNKGAEQLFGLTKEDVLHKTMKELKIGDQTLQEEAMQAVIARGEWDGEFSWKKNDLKKCVVESRWTLVRDAAGEPQSVLVIDTDITEKKELQTQFLRTQRLESLGTLAGGIAHDLNNVLTPILMWTEVLRRKLPDTEMQRMLELLEASARRGVGMVQQVLSFSRGVSGDRVEVQPRHLISDLGKIIRETFPKSIEVMIDYPKNLWTVLGDATQLHQVLLNLCVNARDAMPNGGALNILCENLVVDEHYARMHLDAKPGPYIVVSVVDTGTGIPPELLERIFEPFFTTKELGKGTGLGLSTTIAIVKSHGGFINVYSEPGHGTSFKVYLPATANSVHAAEPESQEELIRGSNELILVVEDEHIIREATQSVLEQYGYRVLFAEDGAQAIARYTQYQSDISVVLTDMMMPIMDGLATIRALQHINPAVKIIGTSGLADNERSVQARKMNIYGFIHKPYSVRDLLKAISTALSSSVPSNAVAV